MSQISQVNELCQKNNLEFNFEKIRTDSKSKQFEIRLKITDKKTKNSVFYKGWSTTVQNAKAIASKKAIADDFLRILKRLNSQSSNNTMNSNSSNRYSTETRHSKTINSTSSGQLSTGIVNLDSNNNSINSSIHKSNRNLSEIKLNFDQFTNYDVRSTQNYDKINPNFKTELIEKNYLYDLYLKSRCSNLPIEIDFVSSHNDQVETICKIANLTVLGSGKNDLEAIQNCAKKIDLNLLNASRTVETEDRSDYMRELNEVHLIMNKSLASICLIAVEHVEQPMYLFKCELGYEFKSFGLDSNKNDAENKAAKKVLKNIRTKLENDIYELDKQAISIKIKKKNINEILDKMDQFEDEHKIKIFKSSLDARI